MARILQSADPTEPLQDPTEPPAEPVAVWNQKRGRNRLCLKRVNLKCSDSCVCCHPCRTLVFSIYELAVIPRDQLTAADLVPVSNSFLNDLDEVHARVLKQLNNFLKLLHEDRRREHLTSCRSWWRLTAAGAEGFYMN